MADEVQNTSLLQQVNEALILACHVLMRPVPEPDTELLEARMAVLRAQDKVSEEKRRRGP